MNIDESTIIEKVDENRALAVLLVDEVIYAISQTLDYNNDVTTCLFVECNDVFAWGCSDAEPITHNDCELPSEIIELYRLHKENSRYGSIKWVCLRRNMQPQGPLKKYMVDAGYWDDVLEALPENGYDKAMRERARQ